MSTGIRILAGVHAEFGQILQDYITGQPDLQLTGWVADGTLLVERITASPPDVVIVDMVLPGLDALAVLERIQSELPSQRPWVLVVTPTVPEFLVQRLLEAGADYLLIKPFNVEILGARIRQLAARGVSTRTVPPWSEDVWGSVALQPARGPEPLEVIIHELLTELGIPTHIKGFRYLRRAVLLVTRDLGLLSGVTKELYPGIAREFHTNPSCVDRAMRHAIDAAWSRGNTNRLQAVFKHTTGRPCNSEFIGTLAASLEKGGMGL